MRINEGKVLLLLSGILVGILISVHIFNKSMNPTTFLTYQEYENKSMEANKLKIELRGLAKEVSRLNRKLAIYSKGQGSQQNTVVNTMSKELNDLRISYGLDKVHGSGVIVSIDDNRKSEYLDSFDLMQSTTHNVDLLRVVKDLKNAGAEAVAINGKRIVGTTSITCEGPVIMINAQYIVPPFIIKAIGDPEILNYALAEEPDSSFRDLEIRNLKLKITKKNDIVIDAIDFVPGTKYAESDEQ